MKEPVWIEMREVLAAHSEQLAAYGGSDGVRDQTLLESALAKPLNVFAYGDPDIFDLAASYAFGIARNHAFIDGNKRTATSISLGFLYINGWDVQAEKEDEYFTFLHLWHFIAISDRRNFDERCCRRKEPSRVNA